MNQRVTTGWAGLPFWAWLAIVLLLALAIRIVLFSGVHGDDDLSIAHCAADLLAQGPSWPQGHYTARFGLIVPTAGVFGLFGIGAWQMAVVPLAFSIAGIAIAGLLARDAAGNQAGLLAALVLAFYPLDITMSTMLFPDIPQAVCVAAAAYCALRTSRGNRPWAWVVAAGVFWGWSYYIKIDSVFLAPVLAYLWWTKRISTRHLVGICAVTGAMVGAEFAAYGLNLGNPFHRLTLEARGAAEVLNPENSFLNRWIYLDAAFLKPTAVGLYFYALAAALIWCAGPRAARFRPYAIWVLTFGFWLQFGGNPLDDRVSIKPQLTRYLLVMAVPMAVLIGGLLARLRERSPRRLFPAAMTLLLVTALPIALYQPVQSERARATTDAVALAKAERFLPLYMDYQSYAVASLLARDGGPALRPIQGHNFLTGQTTHYEVAEPRAYVLINRGNVAALQAMSLVEPPRIDASRFGITEVARIDNPAPAMSYAAIRLARSLAVISGIPALQGRVVSRADEILTGGDAIIYRLDRR